MTMLVALELPSSLHTLLLSRIDQLSERERATLKVASVFGWTVALPDAATRRMFVDNVPYHRELVAVWEQQHT
jgi:hypothetical protein